MGRVEAAGAARPRPGQLRCGDAWAVLAHPTGRQYLAIVDGLGHGNGAADAANAAVAYLTGAIAVSDPPPDVGDLLLGLHVALRPTRGAVAGIVAVDAATGQGVYSGVGNTEVRIIGPGPQRPVSRNGWLGSGRPLAPLVQSLTLAHGGLLVLHTDGAQSPDQLLPPAPHVPLAELATELLENWASPGDDAALLLARWSDRV
jgi:hypothetical protein